MMKREAGGDENPGGWQRSSSNSSTCLALLPWLILFRLLNALLVCTYFTPDEFWQGPEVAHRLAFGQGHLTWEWQEEAQIRGFTHPLVFAALYKALAVAGLDSGWAVANAPKLLQAVLAGVGDWCTHALARAVFSDSAVSPTATTTTAAAAGSSHPYASTPERSHGNGAVTMMKTKMMMMMMMKMMMMTKTKMMRMMTMMTAPSGWDAAQWTLFLQLTNWFNWYCLCRPYSNSAEASLVVIALCLWFPSWGAAPAAAVAARAPAHSGTGSSDATGGFSFGGVREVSGLLVAAFCVAIRPTSAALWMVVGLLVLAGLPPRAWPRYLLTVVLPTVGTVLGLSVLLDSFIYHHLSAGEGCECTDVGVGGNGSGSSSISGSSFSFDCCVLLGEQQQQQQQQQHGVEGQREEGGGLWSWLPWLGCVPGRMMSELVPLLGRPLVLVPLRFVRFNVLQGGSAIFGVQAWHWNFTQGLPAICGGSFPLVLWTLAEPWRRRSSTTKSSGPSSSSSSSSSSSRNSSSSSGSSSSSSRTNAAEARTTAMITAQRRLSGLVLWFLLVHSVSLHKEFRFLLPTLPLLHVLAGQTLAEWLQGRQLVVQQQQQQQQQLVIQEQHSQGGQGVEDMPLGDDEDEEKKKKKKEEEEQQQLVIQQRQGEGQQAGERRHGMTLRRRKGPHVQQLVIQTEDQQDQQDGDELEHKNEQQKEQKEDKYSVGHRQRKGRRQMAAHGGGSRTGAAAVALLVLIAHAPLGLYLGFVHQRGPLAIMASLRHELVIRQQQQLVIQQHDKQEEERCFSAAAVAAAAAVGDTAAGGGVGDSAACGAASNAAGASAVAPTATGGAVAVHFLMPCHSTPLYSHAHVSSGHMGSSSGGIAWVKGGLELDLWSLDCSPSQRQLPEKSEHDKFLADPGGFTRQLYRVGSSTNTTTSSGSGTTGSSNINSSGGFPDATGADADETAGADVVLSSPLPDYIVVFDCHLEAVLGALNSISREQQQLVVQQQQQQQQQQHQEEEEELVGLGVEGEGEGEGEGLNCSPSFGSFSVVSEVFHTHVTGDSDALDSPSSIILLKQERGRREAGGLDRLSQTE